MAGSTLDPDNMNLPDRRLGKGHGIGALGPSDTSDSGSDLQGGPGMAGEEKLHLGGGTTSDIDESTAGSSAGPDVGDANLDSDSDSAGTGEHAAAGRDTNADEGRDIDTDHTFSIGTAGEGIPDDGDASAAQDDEEPTGYQPSLKRSHERPDQRR